MTTQDQTPFRPVENKKRFLWLVEQERFRNNIETLQRISEELAAKRKEFDKLFAETQLTRAETRSLQIMLNKTALKLGLEPLTSRKHDR
jgi:hypothetical protein